jgi:hypothetical protein
MMYPIALATLKDVIMDKKKPQFDHIFANDLDLYKISVAKADIVTELRRIDIDFLEKLDRLNPIIYTSYGICSQILFPAAIYTSLT